MRARSKAWHRQSHDLVKSLWKPGVDQIECHKLSSKWLGFNVFNDQPQLYFASERILGKPRSDDAPANKTKSKILVLVHGTWAADGPSSDQSTYFCNPHSPGAKSIQKYCQASEIAILQWSGKLDDWSGGAQAMREQLGELARLGYQFDIWCHSHGGNLVKQALTGSDLPIGQIVTLATPFRERLVMPISYRDRWWNLYDPGDWVIAMDTLMQWQVSAGGHHLDLSDHHSIEVPGIGHCAIARTQGVEEVIRRLQGMTLAEPAVSAI